MSPSDPASDPPLDPSGDRTGGCEGEAAEAAPFPWELLERPALCHLIMQQIPRFAERPYIADTAALEAALREGLEDALEGDFCWSLSFSTHFLASLCYEGFLPISCELGGGTGLFVLLPKLHIERCVLRFPDLHISRNVRRRAKHYRLTFSTAFCEVMSRCQEQHGECWLHPPLYRGFAALAERRHTPLSASELKPTSGVAAVRLVSFELWRGSQLVAGEIGAIAGCSYTSFTGFYRVSGAGAVQMALTGKVLEAAGFAWYKLSYGARMMPRSRFLHEFRAARQQQSRVSVDSLVQLHGGSFEAMQWLSAGKARADARAPESEPGSPE